jgi:zinc D-Ala-D-Ala carboxypeptidase
MKKSYIIIIFIVVVMFVFISGKLYIKKMENIKLSENFDLGEFMVTNTGLPNIPSKDQIINIKNLVKNVLQPLREYFKQPIKISSGFRSHEVNQKIKGSKTSDHVGGRAADFSIEGVDNQDIINAIKKLGLPFDQLIDEQLYNNKGQLIKWIHVSYRADFSNRKSVMTARNTPHQRKAIYGYA